MTLWSADQSIFEDIDYIFEEIRKQVFDLSECIEQVKKLYDSTAKNTKASQFYFTMWSTLIAQANLMNEMRTFATMSKYNNTRLQIIERLLLMVLKRDADLSGEEITHKILEALSERKKS